jgi:hypothetical protein
MGVLSDASELASDISARIGYIIPPTPDLMGSTGFYPIREAAPGVHVHRGPYGWSTRCSKVSAP